ncbi:hypothetical protein OG579_02575 [Williamsia herbipolensis]|uniref:Uncharacterized protein n=1 Tax=Williamsia herbipolensis TaxID=1603258 RepID=A0AAU4K3U2_9NOCA|nr:hypothetical protein [Williamsia herbipolensis]
MVSGWFRRAPRAGGTPTPRSTAPAPLDGPREAMVRDFLALDQRLSIIAEGVDAAADLATDRSLTREFEPVRASVYASIDWYLRLSGQSTELPAAGTGLVSESEYRQCSEALRTAIADLDRFYTAHSTAIENARAVRAAVPDQAGATARASDAAVDAVGALDPHLRDYSSIRAAVAEHARARDAFDRARTAGESSVIHNATADLASAVADLRAAVVEAPGRAEEVRRALASVRTRRSAVATRAQRLPQAYSALLREFSAACSEDLVGDDRRGDEALRSADHFIDAATELLAGDPDAAAERVASARGRLADAEGFVDGVTDRLALLRDVRADPRRLEADVRFAIRDAQLLAVDRRLVPRWGSVLDAAAARVERATAALVGTHPDYWGYVQELTSVSGFVAETVAKMKGEGRR